MTREKESGRLEELAVEARDVLRGARHGVLATLSAEKGFPYASVVDVAGLEGGDLLLLLSDLAEHTRNLRADSRASLVVAASEGEGELLERGRASFQGKVEAVGGGEIDDLRARYLEVHPQAKGYVGFADFHFFRLRVERVRFIAGFGRMGWVEGALWRQISASTAG
ncbi:hypothetical protein DV096_00795 [Bradymonadaceae bacterium TMQ3]|uniref:CREG-like beta-barrel domain-containing protein n=1 Tax=Lujinxingia sediminis TaxID=2480984 RepID=A0ABY0CY51_9DELT|nr:pyridoxamine 5'-phosphate oxidase family protein [Lujinxingia sediminis]RDV39143.1 hypothetical protein DV096_00795 [Bradymonadaceae bacterium TMQ3]RVU48812.1 hypothetical protein EA187_05130 [Lujinxingia sediminis]TXC78105.1 hypothetical protein FRC91_05095 [Bradymonadales bacterium TMQ1]